MNATTTMTAKQVKSLIQQAFPDVKILVRKKTSLYDYYFAVTVPTEHQKAIQAFCVKEVPNAIFY